jgi:hypothetical protein
LTPLLFLFVLPRNPGIDLGHTRVFYEVHEVLGVVKDWNAKVSVKREDADDEDHLHQGSFNK